jgi:hypothetical protein
MDYTIEFDAPAEKIYQDFTSREYWQTLMDAYRFLTPQSEITSFATGERGTDVVFVQNLSRMYLPPIARTVMPVDLIITRTQHFDPYDHDKNRAKGNYAASIPHGPGSFGGQYFLTDTDTDDGSRLRLASVCKVYIPIIGGALEDLILHHIKQLFRRRGGGTSRLGGSVHR